MQSKICPHCHQEKPFKEFYNDCSQKGGVSCWCKKCHSEDNKRYSYDRSTYQKHYYLYNSERMRERQRIRRYRIKIEVLKHYGKGKPACIICGESRLRCLSIDHIEEGGAEHRRKIGTSKSAHFCEWLKQQGFPEGYQTLCMNCQWVKHYEWKEAKENAR